MFTKPFWIEGPCHGGGVAISPRPRGADWLDDEMKYWHHVGIDAVVSLLEPAEAKDLGLEREREACEDNGIRFYSLPIADRSVPRSDQEVAQLLQQVEGELKQGNRVVIHCRQGVGRAGLIAATLLVDLGMSTPEAVKSVSSARGIQVPETEEQRDWIDSYAVALGQKS